MQVTMLKGKIHRAVVQQAELNYVGSITVDPVLMDAAGIYEYEKVQIVDIEKEFDGKGYGDFKLAVGEAVADILTPIHTRFDELSKDKAYIDSIIKENADKANYYATKTLRKVQKKVGFPERIR